MKKKKKTIALFFFQRSRALLAFLLPSTSSSPFSSLSKIKNQGPQYVVTNFNIFVCTVCSGVQ